VNRQQVPRPRGNQWRSVVSTVRKTAGNGPYEFIANNYRDPGGEDRIRRWLPHPEVARAICGTLRACGVHRCDVEDRLQDVDAKVLTAFRGGGAVPPPDLRAMKAYCATAAKNLVIDLRREAAKRERDLAETCERDEYGIGEPDCAEPHDRLDTGKQVEVLASLFREGLMPRDGVFILEGVAAGRSCAEIAKDLKIGRELVKWRMRKMRQIWRERMETLGMVPRMPSLRVIVCEPSAIPLLRAAA
jgi:DNA-directed RNA polymerase specialized sigma24 family protein